MACTINVIFTPSEYDALRQRDLSESVCVVFDILRATSVMVTALANGAKGIIPVEEINDALEIRQHHPDVLLGGERNGVRITAEQTGGVDFDLGNSPREYTADVVSGRTIVSTTTNGTRALAACSGSKSVVAASFLNLVAVVEFVANQPGRIVHLICAGTGNCASLEDALAAGAFCELIRDAMPTVNLTDSSKIAWRAYRHSMDDLPATVRSSLNGQRLFENPALRDDVEYCLRRDCYRLVPILNADGVIRKSS
jgi:2-phosphosulfolactate phosphatase